MKQTVKRNQEFHIGKKVAGGATGAVLGAVMGGPVGALVGGVLGTMAGRVAENGLAPTPGARAKTAVRNGSFPKTARPLKANTGKSAPAKKNGKPSRQPARMKSSGRRAAANGRKGRQRRSGG